MNELPDFNKLWNYKKPKETEAKFLELLLQVESAKNDYYQYELLTQIARTQGLQRKFEAAHETLNGIEEWLKNHPEAYRIQIRYLLERGRTFNSSNQQSKAIPLFNKAWKLAVKAGEDYYGVDALHMIAYAEIANPDEKLKWEEEAMELAEKSNDERAKLWLGTLYNNMGWSYHNKKEYHKALILFEKALAWQKKRGNKDSIRIARWCIGRVYRSLSRVADALNLQQELLEGVEGNDPSGYIWEELGECYLILGEKDKSQSHFKLAYEKLLQDVWMMANEKQRMERMKNLAEIA